MSARRAELHAIVLAAGSARRFGTLKQLQQIEGEALLLRVARRAGTAVDHTAVVLGARAETLTALLAGEPFRLHVNTHWVEGLASSIRTGIAALPRACAGAMVVLADQAAIRAEQYAQLAALWRQAPDSIAAAHYGGSAGAPAIFPRRLFAALRALEGDVGARGLLREHASDLITLEMPSAALDLDTPEDLAACLSCGPH
jgi:CTP:molybdopterin cytidylyltransferase MocA